MKSYILFIIGLLLVSSSALNTVDCKLSVASGTYNLNPLKKPVGESYYINYNFTETEVPYNYTYI